ncbi:polypeptide chain release factor [Apiospora rasikravindrae]|uniref:Polypeptide chain release factor n=1 Tax=Apiospora rasikravindrae TaxID=990691 RepID=A0ABR1SLN1_9PEZI
MATIRATRVLAFPFSHQTQLLKPAAVTISSSTSHHPLSNYSCHGRALSTTPSLQKKTPQYPPKPQPPPDSDLDESFLKGSGPGGQKINKTNSAVQLKHLPTGIVVKCQETRSRSQNRLIARQLLANRLDDLTNGDQSRSAIVGDAKRKKRASSAKKSRRKYRKLDEERLGEVASAAEGEEEELGEQDEVDSHPEEVRETASRNDETTSHNVKAEDEEPESPRLPRETNETVNP